MKTLFSVLLMLIAVTGYSQITSIGSASTDIIVSSGTTVTLTQNTIIANSVKIEYGATVILDPPANGQHLKVGSLTVMGTLKTNGTVSGSNGNPTKLKISINAEEENERIFLIDGGRVILTGEAKEPLDVPI